MVIKAISPLKMVALSVTFQVFGKYVLIPTVNIKNVLLLIFLNKINNLIERDKNYFCIKIILPLSSF